MARERAEAMNNRTGGYHTGGYVRIHICNIISPVDRHIDLWSSKRHVKYNHVMSHVGGAALILAHVSYHNRRGEQRRVLEAARRLPVIINLRPYA